MVVGLVDIAGGQPALGRAHGHVALCPHTGLTSSATPHVLIHVFIITAAGCRFPMSIYSSVRSIIIERFVGEDEGKEGGKSCPGTTNGTDHNTHETFPHTFRM